jgi:hypothetical protein
MRKANIKHWKAFLPWADNGRRMTRPRGLCAGNPASPCQHRGARRPATADTPKRSRGANAPGLCVNVPPSKNEGVRNAGCRTHPQPRVQKVKAHELVTTNTPDASGVPHAVRSDGISAWRPRRTLRVSAVCRAFAYRRHDLRLRRERDRTGRPDVIWCGATATGTTHAFLRPRAAQSSSGSAFHAPAFERRIASTAARPAFVTIAIRPSVGSGE